MGKSWVRFGLLGFGVLAASTFFGCASNERKPLYDRLGGEQTIQVVVEDFVGRAAGDPKVNFTRKGTGQEWNPTPENVEKLKGASGRVFGGGDWRATGL